MKRYRICSICEREWNVSGKEKSEKKYICPHCEYKRSRPGAGTPKAARKNMMHPDYKGLERKMQYGNYAPKGGR